jgi:TfoX/Sxy family transcriptional regulator of competence genes
MAWTKIPAENHPLFRAALPADPRVRVIAMFGGLCATVNGNMAAGLFARSVFVTLDDAGAKEALALDGAEPFDPMGRGQSMPGRVMLPETVVDEPAELRAWLRRSIDHTAKMPPKKKAATKKPAATSKRVARPKAAAKPRAKPAKRAASRAKRR